MEIRGSVSLRYVVTSPRRFSRLGKVLPYWANISMTFFAESLKYWDELKLHAIRPFSRVI